MARHSLQWKLLQCPNLSPEHQLRSLSTKCSLSKRHRCTVLFSAEELTQSWMQRHKGLRPKGVATLLEATLLLWSPAPPMASRANEPEPTSPRGFPWAYGCLQTLDLLKVSWPGTWCKLKIKRPWEYQRGYNMNSNHTRLLYIFLKRIHVVGP